MEKRACGQSRISASDLALVAMFAAIIAICSWITIPFTIPFTLQTFGVFAAVCLLGGKRGVMAVTLWVLLGVVGLPVFSGFRGGIGVLLSNTGGYIAGFILGSLAMWGLERIARNARFIRVLSMLVALVVCYLFGTLWFLVVYTKANGPVALGTVLGWCVLPFVPFDLAKIALCEVLVSRLKPRLKL